MKGNLITNGILSFFSSSIEISGLIFFLINLPKIHLLYSVKFSSMLFLIIIILFYILIRIPCFIVGLVTLFMEKDLRVRGLTIASGILSLIGGFFFITTIISFTAVYKMSK